MENGRCARLGRHAGTSTCHYRPIQRRSGTLLESVHSRLPVHDGAPDDMLGVLQAKDLLEAYLRGEAPDPRARVRPAPNVPTPRTLSTYWK